MLASCSLADILLTISQYICLNCRPVFIPLLYMNCRHLFGVLYLGCSVFGLFYVWLFISDVTSCVFHLGRIYFGCFYFLGYFISGGFYLGGFYKRCSTCCIVLQMIANNPMFASNPQLQQQAQQMMPAMMQRVCNIISTCKLEGL